MIQVNPHYAKLQSSYLFSEIARKVEEYRSAHPDSEIIRLGIGDVTLALPPSITAAFRDAVEEMGSDAGFHGYGPEQGYAFLREAIAEGDFGSRGINIAPDEIFISDGAKCDTGNIQELFATDIRVGVPDPVYPVYVDTNVMAGRTGAYDNGRFEGLSYFVANAENNFIPSPPESGQDTVDLIYLCFPNNPTGATASKEQLAAWVEYAQAHNSLILFDAAYEAYVRDPELPSSIYEIPGAEKVAVEFRSFSKTAGFTGTRCAYTVVPRACTAYDQTGAAVSVRELWNRRHTTKFNGVSYPVQKAAAACFTETGREELRHMTDYYLLNAGLIRTAIESFGYSCVGGVNSPYVWINCRGDSWAFFDRALERAGVVITPGTGFGPAGEGYVRISAFNHRDKVEQALERLTQAFEQ